MIQTVCCKHNTALSTIYLLYSTRSEIQGHNLREALELQPSSGIIIV